MLALLVLAAGLVGPKDRMRVCRVLCQDDAVFKVLQLKAVMMLRLHMEAVLACVPKC